MFATDGTGSKLGHENGYSRSTLKEGKEMATSALSFKEDRLPRFGGMIGLSQELRDVWHSVHMAARTDSTVLIQGETGPGKNCCPRRYTRRACAAAGRSQR